MSRRIGRRGIGRWLAGKVTVSRLLGVGIGDLEQLLWHGHAHLSSGNSADAARIYELAVSLWPERAEPRLGRGACRQALGDLAGAESAYSEVLDIDPHNPFARANRAEVRILLGRGDDARLDLGRLSASKRLPKSLIARVDQLIQATGRPEV